MADPTYAKEAIQVTPKDFQMLIAMVVRDAGGRIAINMTELPTGHLTRHVDPETGRTILEYHDEQQ